MIPREARRVAARPIHGPCDCVQITCPGDGHPSTGYDCYADAEVRVDGAQYCRQCADFHESLKAKERRR